MAKRYSIACDAQDADSAVPLSYSRGTRIKQRTAVLVAYTPQVRAERPAQIAQRIADERALISYWVKDLPAARWANRLCDIICSER